MASCFHFKHTIHVSNSLACILDAPEFWGRNPFGLLVPNLHVKVMQHMCWKYSWLNKTKLLILNMEWRNFPFGGEQGFTAENHGLRFTGLLTSSRQINNEDFFSWFWLTSLAQFFLAGFKGRISSLVIAARAIKVPWLPALWRVQRTSAHVFLPISSPGNYFPYPAVLTSFPFSATCTQKANSSPRGNMRDVLHPRTTLSTLCFGSEKGGKTITCLSELFGRGKQVSLCSHLCNPGRDWGRYRKVKRHPWFKGRRMVWWHNETEASLSVHADTEHYAERGMLVPQFPCCSTVAVGPAPITGLLPTFQGQL